MTVQELNNHSTGRLCEMVKQQGMQPRGGRAGYIRQLLGTASGNLALASATAAPATAPKVQPVTMVPDVPQRRRLPDKPPALKIEPPLEDRLLSVAEAARMLGVGMRTIWQLLSAGVLTRIKPSAKRTCVSFLEVQAHIANLRGNGNATAAAA